ncbi:MAG: hypothetical protein ACTHOJ_17305 [Sphingomonas oligoaromativorans]
MTRWLRELFGSCEHQWRMTEYSVIKRRVSAHGVAEAVSIADFRQCTRCGDIQAFVF